jgi:hypothetical protein
LNYITKSQCAFIQVESDFDLEQLIKDLNGSQFKGSTLACRIRSNNASIAAGTSPPRHSPRASFGTLSTSTANATGIPSVDFVPTVEMSLTALSDSLADESSVSLTQGLTFENRYFIMKSFTVDDFKISMDKGCWATQHKNEPALNRAFGVILYKLNCLCPLYLFRSYRIPYRIIFPCFVLNHLDY